MRLPRRVPLSVWLLRLLVAVLCALSLPCAAVSVTRSPSSSNCTSLATGGTRVWNLPTLAAADDNLYAYVGVDGTTTRYLQCLNYGFSIPSGAVIDGITVTVRRKTSRTTDGGSRDAYMRLVKGGVVGSTDRSNATLYTTSEVADAHGGSSDLWGQTWTAADINAANFGAAFAATKPNSAGRSHTISVDLISITVSYTVDTTPPTVASMTRASLNPASSSTVAWTVTFSEAVTGVDATDFALVNGGLSGTSIASVTGSGAVWTVTANTGSGSGTLGLNLVDNDSIVDPSANKLGGTGTSGGTSGSFTGAVYTLDKTNPNAVSINRVGASPSNAASLAWTVTFSESVTGVDSGDFALAATGSAGASISSVTGSGATWTVTASGVSGTGTLGLNLVDNDSIIDNLLHPLGGAGAGNGNQAGQSYTVDRDGPTVASIARSDPSPSTAAALSWTVTFSESVSGVDSADFALASSGLAGASITAVSGSGTTWSVTADPGWGAGTLGLNLVDGDSITDALGNPLGGAGAGNGNFTGAVYTVTTEPVASYRMDENAWDGKSGQVADELGAYPATARNSATTAGVTAALAGASGTCRYGVFYNSGSPTIKQGYLDLGSGFPYFSSSFTLTAWVRSAANSVGKQWIFTHNTGGRGYALALGTPGPGRLRFQSGGAATPNLDTPSGAASLLANDTWYFVAAVADFEGEPDIVRSLYVFDSAGKLLSGYPASLTSTGWDDTEAGSASIGGDGSDSFRGWLDEVQVFDKALNEAALQALAQDRHPCGAAVPDHYELSVPASSLACLPTSVTVAACADASSPCNNPFTDAAGSSVTLSASAGSLGATTLKLDAKGMASTSLSHPDAADGSAVSVALSGESLAGSAARQCCADGTACKAAASCTSVFSTAGFIVAASAGGATATPAAQTAGTASATHYLRAVKTSTTTKACEAALTGAGTVDWALQCLDPSTCSSGNRMTLTGSSATAIASNPASGVSSRTAVPMVFDADGNAPFSLNYADVGQVRLWASKSVNGAALAGSSNAFVVKPAGFAIGTVQQAVSPNLANPGATSAAGAKFVRAGEGFGLSVTAQTSSGATAPNFGRESSAEGVLLTPTLLQPAGGSAGTLANATIAGASFSAGVASVANLAYSEVGIISLTPSVADGSYLGAGAVTGTASGAIGRFYPARFALSGGSVTHRSGRGCTPAASTSYLGENFGLDFTLAAQNLAGATTQNYSGSFAFFNPAMAAGWNLAGLDGSTAFSVAGGRLALGSAGGSWSNGQAAVTITAQALRAASPDGPFNAAFGVAPQDSDGVALGTLDMASSAGGANDRGRVANVALRFGRLRLANATGAGDRALALALTAQYWNGSAWDTDTLDSCSTLPAGAASFGNLRGTLLAADLAASPAMALAAGVAQLRLPAPAGGRRGSVDVALSLGSSATDASCLQSWTPVRAATTGANLAHLRSNWCGSSHDKDTAARASFGLPRTQGHLLHRRENF